MRVLVATDIAARGLDIDQLPQVVNFELPNVPEDYVHRIGRTGRAGSSGAAVSLVDREELKLLKDIEKLIKREIPKVQVEGFVPSDKPDPEPPRSTQPHGRPPRGHSRKPQNAGDGQNTERNQGRNQSQERRPATNATGPQPQRNSERSTSTKFMSEAARHQAMPQSALFSPPSPPPRGGQNRGTQGHAPQGHGQPGRSSHKPNNPHRSGGRGR
jgi:ATP-dependent RNA helicase RhlE